MRHKPYYLLFSALVGMMLIPSAFALQAAPRETLSLDGVWTFATDPDEIGEKEKWFARGNTLPKMPRDGYAPTADGTIRVPGCWDAQGYGTETQKLKHNFVGKGWYKKTVAIPENWSGNKFYLTVTGVARYAKVWIDGEFVGPEAIGCVSSHSWNVTDRLVPGTEAEITICVDSKQRYEIDALVGCAQIIDYMDISWGGIWGHVRLEMKPPVRLEEPYVRTKYREGSCRIETTIVKEVVSTDCDALKLEIFEYDTEQLVTESTIRLSGDRKLIDDETPIAIEAIVPDPKLWSPYDPNLYVARLTLQAANRPIDVLRTRFGIRELWTEGSALFLNGKKLMLHGYGDDHIYPHDWSYSANKEMYLERLRLIKSFGFNYVRHHSTTMPPEYYEACDEVGIMPMVEYLIGYQHYMPGESGWLGKVPERTSPEPVVRTYLERWEAVVKQYRNHPSILCWVLGNELWSEKPILTTLRHECKRIAKHYDPDRFFLDSAGIWRHHIMNPENDRDTVDLYCCLFDEWCSPILSSTKFDFPDPLKPTISHESGNFITFIRPDEIELYETSNFKPFWMIPGREKLKQLGLLEEAFDWAVASEKLYFLHHKYNVESLRKNPKLSGYQWWLIQDYWTTSNGLVDTNFRLKSIKPEDVRVFNGPVVLLQEGLDTTYRGGEFLNAKLLLSNYSPETLSGQLSWTLTLDDRNLCGGETGIPKAEQGSLLSTTEIAAKLPSIDVPGMMKLSVALHADDGKVYGNSWTAWIFPEKIVPETGETAVYSDETTLVKLPENGKRWSLKPMPENDRLPHDAVYLVSWLSAPLVDAMERGAGVVLLGGLAETPSIGIKYQSVWWKGGDSEESNHVGTYIYDHPIVRDIAPDRWGNIAWAHLIQGAEKYNVENAPSRPEIVVRALPSLVRVQETPLLYRVGVGKGTLIVSGLNHAEAAERPENAWIVAKMIEDAARFSPPATRWPSDFCLKKPEVPDGMTLGYRRVFPKSAEITTWHSYRRHDEQTFVCRQSGTDRFLEWETEVLPNQVPEETVTLIFAGALGFATEPKTAGFELIVEGNPVLKFDLPEPTKWESDDGKSVLEFRVKKTIGPDSFGLFTLTFQKSMLKPGQPVRLGVKSLGSGSRRWFGLHPIVDMKNDFSP